MEGLGVGQRLASPVTGRCSLIYARAMLSDPNPGRAGSPVEVLALCAVLSRNRIRLLPTENTQVPRYMVLGTHYAEAGIKYTGTVFNKLSHGRYITGGLRLLF